MLSSIVIRAFEAVDVPAVSALVSAILSAHGFATAQLASVARDLEEGAGRYRGRRAGFWVAEANGEVGGSVAIRPKDERTCELKRLYVRADQREIGLGQRLYAHAEERARAFGYDRVWLDSSRRFESAHRLYLRNGFRLVEELDNEWEDSVYAKALGP